MPFSLADELALAVVASAGAPMLLLNGDMVVLAASDSFHEGFGLLRSETVGRPIFELDDGRWTLPRLRSALAASLTADGAIEAYELDVPSRERGVRRLVLKAQRLVYADEANPRILLSIADVTDARQAEQLKDELIRERALLLREVQHRVANSLQIIASVLMQSARKVQSEEARRHLRDAHNRVMSIASVQDQLAVSGLADVALRPYLTQLCASIGASMIPDADQLALTVTSDEAVVAAEVSVSMGLIVTELVINALTHAFPDGAAGRIEVEFRTAESAWTLSVSDNGVGMPVAPEVAESGLGSSIVQALARQLKAVATVSDNGPGTRVCVTHEAQQGEGDGTGRMADTPAV